MKTIRKIILFLKIIQLKDIKPYPNDYSYSKSRYNPYNPLTYLFFSLVIPIIILIDIIKSVKKIGNPFKYN
jgi:hypothetical protein